MQTKKGEAITTPAKEAGFKSPSASTPLGDMVVEPSKAMPSKEKDSPDADPAPRESTVKALVPWRKLAKKPVPIEDTGIALHLADSSAKRDRGLLPPPAALQAAGLLPARADMSVDEASAVTRERPKDRKIGVIPPARRLLPFS